MWDDLAEKVSDLFDDLSYSFKRGVGYFFGKSALGLVQDVLHISSFVGLAFAGSPLGIALMAGVAALSSGLAQMDHVHRRKRICNFYRDEIAAKLGMEAKDVTEKHMELVAYGDTKRDLKGNAAIRTALEDSSKDRWLGVALSFVGSVTAMSTAHALGITNWVARGLVGLATYNIIKHPLHWTLAPLVGMDRPTVNDRIKRIDRDLTLGKDITQERILGVFIEAHPGIDENVHAAYGKKYEKLSEMQQREVAVHFNEVLKLDHLATDINHGRMKPAELAFTVEGDFSGVPPMAGRREEKRGLVSLGLDYCKRCAQAAILGLPGRRPPEKLMHAAPTLFKIADKVFDGSQERAATPQEEPESPLEKKFVGRFGIKPKDTSMGYVQSLEQGRENPELKTVFR